MIRPSDETYQEFCLTCVDYRHTSPRARAWLARVLFAYAVDHPDDALREFYSRIGEARRARLKAAEKPDDAT